MAVFAEQHRSKLGLADGESILHEVRVNFRLATKKDFLNGFWFVSEKKTGFIGFDGKTISTDLEFVRDIGISKEKSIIIRWVSRYGAIQWDNDTVYEINSESMEIDEAFNAVFDYKCMNVLQPLHRELAKASNLSLKDQHLEALNILFKLKEDDVKSLVLDVLIARTLSQLGRGQEGATHLARQWYRAIEYPNLVLTEFLWCDWHIAALRYLPDKANLQGEWGKTIGLLLDAVEARSQNDMVKFAKFVADALVRINLENSPNIFIIKVFMRLLVINSPETLQSTDKVAKFVLKSIINSDHKVGLPFKDLLEDFLNDSENFNVQKFLPRYEEIFKNNDDGSLKLLLEEDYGQILNLIFQEKKTLHPKIPNMWDLVEDNWYTTKEPRLPVYKLNQIRALTRLKKFSYLELYTKFQELKTNWNYKLFEYSTNWNFFLLESELALKNGRVQEGLKAISNGLKVIREVTGSYFYDELRYATDIAAFFEAWAFSSPSLVKDAVENIPKKKPLLWLHKLADEVLVILENQVAPPENLTEAVGLLKDIAKNINVIMGAPNVTKDVKKQVQKHLCSLIARLKDPELRIAIGGETSAGKTTFLNRLFQTNLFFVTQEEATGVSTEIRHGERIRVEVLDSSGVLRDFVEVKSLTLKFQKEKSNQNSIEKVRSFISKYTRVHDEDLGWVDTVKIYLPISELPKNLVLIDTPGFNAHQDRTEIANKVISDSHVCLFVIDARNALKHKEMERMIASSEELGKLFFVLNKIDLVLGDDDLDCDGSDSIDQTIARVRQELISHFKVKDVYLFPVCSLNKDEVSSELYQYVDIINELRNKIFSETLSQRMELIIGAAAKESLIASNCVLDMVDKLINDYETKELNLQKAVPDDPHLFEAEIYERVQEKVQQFRNDYIEAIVNEIHEEFKQTIDNMAIWMQSVTSVNTLKNEAAVVAQQRSNDLVKTLDDKRKYLLGRISQKTVEYLAQIFQELYYNLPFKASFSPQSLTRYTTFLEQADTSLLRIQIQNIDEGHGFGGAMAGLALGGILLGPIGAGIGSWLGNKIFAKPIEEIKQEIWDPFIKGMEQLEKSVYEIYDKDIDFETNNSFLVKLHDTIESQVANYYKVVNDKINRINNEIEELLQDLNSLKQVTCDLLNSVEKLKRWRSYRRCLHISDSTEFTIVNEELLNIVIDEIEVIYEKTASSFNANTREDDEELDYLQILQLALQDVEE